MVDFLIKTIKGAIRVKKPDSQKPSPKTQAQPKKSPEKKEAPRVDSGDEAQKKSAPQRRRRGPKKPDASSGDPEKKSGSNPKSGSSEKKSEGGNKPRQGRGQAGRPGRKPGGARRRQGESTPADRSPGTPSPESRHPGRDNARLARLLEEDAAWDPASYDPPVAEGKTRFNDLPIHRSLIHAIADLGFQHCTPIQAELLEHTLAGKDATGQAQTGTGKTAAFLVAAFCRLLKDRENPDVVGKPRALILAPTRELVIQIEKDAHALGKYLSLHSVAVFGGTGYQRQEDALQRPVDVLIATPGRLIDFCQKRVVDLSEVEILVIDEADRMLDMGFIPDVKRIVYMTPHKDKRQTLFFSATLTSDVKRLAESWTKNAVNVAIEPESVASDQVEQRVYIITSDQKFALLYNLLKQEDLHRVIIFTNRRDQARQLTMYLHAYGFNCALLSGELAQNVRTRTLEGFREGKIDIMVATDVAGRGIHVEGVSHVVNYFLPMDAEDYVHRIGRTGRAGAEGTSISFADEEQGFHVPEIEEYIGRELKCEVPSDELLAPVPAVKKEAMDEARKKFAGRPEGPRTGGSRGGRSGGGRSGGGPNRNRSGRR